MKHICKLFYMYIYKILEENKSGGDILQSRQYVPRTVLVTGNNNDTIILVIVNQDDHTRNKWKELKLREAEYL